MLIANTRTSIPRPGLCLTLYFPVTIRLWRSLPAMCTSGPGLI